VPLSVGLVGAGSAALRAHLPALGRATEAGVAAISAVCDPSPERRALVRERCPAASEHVDVEELLEEARPDLLVVASPPSSHLPALRAAAAREVDVLCEKPLGLRGEDVAALGELRSTHSHLLLATVHQYQHAPAWGVIAPALRQGVLRGEPLALTVEVERPGTDPLSAGGWRAAGLREGGVLGDHAVHYLALCWSVDPAARLLDVSQEGDPGAETARLRVAIGAGTATITVSYAGRRRRNLVAAHLAARGLGLRWLDGELGIAEEGVARTVEPTVALSDRQAVNDLYGPLYDELLARREDPAWRSERGAETLGVASLLAAALDALR